MRRLDIVNMVSGFLLVQPKLWLLARTLRRSLEDKEEEEVLVPFLVRRDAVAIDVGANRGDYTRVLLRRTRNVVCIEPNPENVRILERVFGRELRVVAGAASNKTEDVDLRIPTFGSGYATIDDGNRFLPDEYRAVSVRTYKIDDLDLDNVSFIKIDVEGHELSVLEGALSVIKKSRPSILVEAEERYRSRAVVTLRELLEPLGYEGFMLLKGQLVSIRDFNPAIHQKVEIARLRRRAHRIRDPYIKNFIFMATGTVGAA